jgi:hypothetical protein
VLFQRLYNWIKYKTLPPSILFKNRLFIERDNKNKRIMSNFGLSFRNSKWSSYSVYNIKTSFKQNYFNFFFFLFFIIFVIFFIINFKKYYLFSYSYNFLSFFFWFSLDSFDYYFSYFFWVIFSFFSFFFNSFYSYFFFNNFSNRNFLNFSVTNSKNILNKNEKLSLSKNDTNWFFYSFFTSNGDKKKINEIFDNKLIENLFSTNVNTKLWNVYSDFYLKLFKLTYFFNLTSSTKNSFFLSVFLNEINKLKTCNIGNFAHYFLNNTSFLTSYSFLFFNNNNTNLFNLINKKNEFYFLNSNKYWNIQTIENENNIYNFLINNKIGFFFFNNISHGKLNDFVQNNSEFNNFNLFIINQTKIAKINRWLYRYSILHRKLLKNSHKITMIKKILNFNFYSKNDFNKNLWTSEHLSKLFSKNSNTFNFFNAFNSLNINFFTENNNSSSNELMYSKTNNFFSITNGIKFYENSYFWFLKRFYIFNSLSNNSTYSNKTLSVSRTNEKGNYFLNKKTLNENFYYKSYFSFFNIYFNEIYYNFTNNNSNLFTSKNLNDVFLNINEKDFFNKDRLEIFPYFLSNINNSSSDFFVFNNLLKINTLNNNKRVIFFFNEPFVYSSITSNILFSNFNTDSFFLSDLNYFLMFK